jgi:hypothetical protein
MLNTRLWVLLSVYYTRRSLFYSSVKPYPSTLVQHSIASCFRRFAREQSQVGGTGISAGTPNNYLGRGQERDRGRRLAVHVFNPLQAFTDTTGRVLRAARRIANSYGALSGEPGTRQDVVVSDPCSLLARINTETSSCVLRRTPEGLGPAKKLYTPKFV